MWNALFSVLVIMLVALCFHKLAKRYGDTWKAALCTMESQSLDSSNYNAKLSGHCYRFKLYLAAHIMCEIGYGVGLYFLIVHTNKLLPYMF